MRSAAGVFVMLMLVDDGETRFLLGSGLWSWGSDRIKSNGMEWVWLQFVQSMGFFLVAIWVDLILPYW